jgi:glycosyltransferase involved in cell wall biosynthesis
VGLVPHHATESWNTTIPNKLFDYMAAGLAVITSDAAPAARVVRETGAGAVYPHEDPEALAIVFAEMASAHVRGAYGRCGRDAIRDRYHWELDAERMEALLHAAIEVRA